MSDANDNYDCDRSPNRAENKVGFELKDNGDAQSVRLYFLRLNKRYILFLTLASYSCHRLPESFPPPEQRHPVGGVGLLRASMMVTMNDKDAEAHFVKDIGLKLESGYWRWAQKQPTVKILLAKTQGLKFSTNFTLFEGCMAQTGPVVIGFRIGDKLLAKERYTTPGYKHFEKPVPADWLQTSTETLVSEEIDKLFVSPEDGVKLGFIVSNMGFERQ